MKLAAVVGPLVTGKVAPAATGGTVTVLGAITSFCAATLPLVQWTAGVIAAVTGALSLYWIIKQHLKNKAAGK